MQEKFFKICAQSFHRFSTVMNNLMLSLQPYKSILQLKYEKTQDYRIKPTLCR